ncbi:MAG TPA: hypothetical protein VIL20_02045 [Sandaracinaceae bacterium]
MLPLTLYLAACGAPGDGGGDAGADGSTGVPCGPVTCAAGQVCCNASCGLCLEPGGSCTGQECSDAGSDAGGSPSDGGPTCGGETCGAGELCCPGCGGAMRCEPGPTCPDVSCPPTCNPTEPCGPGEFCEITDGSCGVGTCQPRPTVCPGDCPGVCGCDGVQYCNVCLAHRAGVDVAEGGGCAPPTCAPMDARDPDGSCPGTLGFAFDGARCVGLHCTCEGTDCDSLYPTSDACEAAYAHCLGGGGTCGGFLGTPCPPGEYCDSPDELCGAADGSGVCRPIPTDCSGQASAPVCGCDGVTYDNACEAHLAGVDDASPGPCDPPPADCRTTGCPSGSRCTHCASGWICLPAGMICAL